MVASDFRESNKNGNENRNSVLFSHGGGEKIPPKTVEEIKKAIKKKLENSLEKNFDRNGTNKRLSGGGSRKDETNRIRKEAMAETGQGEKKAGSEDSGGMDAENVAEIQKNLEDSGLINKNKYNKRQKIQNNIKARMANVKQMRAKIKKKSLQKLKINLKKKIVIRRKNLRKSFGKKIRGKVIGNGKSVQVTSLFAVMMFLAFINDFSDIFVGLTTQIIALLASLTVFLAPIALPAISVIENIGDGVDVITSVILIAFSIFIGVSGKGGKKKIAKRIIKTLIKYGLAFLVEMIPIVNLFESWMVAVAWDWYEIRKEADKN